MKIIPEDIVNYCTDNQSLYLVHGTTTDTIESFIEDGLAINPNKINRPTVLFWKSGISQKGTRITDYTWCESHSYSSFSSSDCCVIFEVPNAILNAIKEEGKDVNQENIFKKICKQKVMTVPDCEFTRDAYNQMQQAENLDSSNDDLFSLNSNPSFGPKYSPYGAEPNSPFIGFGIPPKYILAITDSKQVYYVSNKIKNYVSKRDGLNISFPIDEEQTTDSNINQEYIEAYLNFVKNKNLSTKLENDTQDQNAWLDNKFPFDGWGIDGM